MSSFGCLLSSEEIAPREMVRLARVAEHAGVDRIWVSDHCHPWSDKQGESGFVWAVLGAIPMRMGFEALADTVTAEQVAEEVPCGPDPQKVAEVLSGYVDQGFEEIYAGQMGPDQEGGIRFLTDEVLPLLT